MDFFTIFIVLALAWVLLLLFFAVASDDSDRPARPARPARPGPPLDVVKERIQKDWTPKDVAFVESITLPPITVAEGETWQDVLPRLSEDWRAALDSTEQLSESAITELVDAAYTASELLPPVDVRALDTPDAFSQARRAEFGHRSDEAPWREPLFDALVGAAITLFPNKGEQLAKSLFSIGLHATYYNSDGEMHYDGQSHTEEKLKAMVSLSALLQGASLRQKELMANCLLYQLRSLPEAESLNGAMGHFQTASVDSVPLLEMAFLSDLAAVVIGAPRAESLNALLLGTEQLIFEAEVALVSRKPVSLKRNPEGRLHCEDGPARAYLGGALTYAWNGTKIPAGWTKGKLPPVPQLLGWENMEQRRVGCEILGWDKILDSVDCKTLDTHENPQMGELLLVRLPNTGPELFLKYQCGTGRAFASCVTDSRARTVQAAQNWIWSMPSGVDYNPEHRT